MNRSPSSAPRSGARRRGALGLVAILGALALILATLPAAAAAPKTTGGRELKAKPLTVTTRVVGAKSASGKLAKTDRSLLGLKSSAPRNVVVKLDYDSLAAYRGGVKGYAATSPSVTRRKLSTRDANVRRYAGYVAGVESGFKRALQARVPGARTGRSLRTVYGGVAVKVAGNRIADLLRIPGVVAVQKDTPQQLLTEYFRGRGLEPLDLLEAFRRERVPLFWERDEHLNMRGQQLAARLIARSVMSSRDTGAVTANVPRPLPVRARATRAAPVRPIALPYVVDFADSSARELLDGWYSAETAGGRTFAWSRGDRSAVRLGLRPMGDVRLTFEAMPLKLPRSPTQRVSVSVNGREVTTQPLREGLHRYAIVLPAEAFGEPPQLVEFRYAYARAPRSSDARRLAVAWYSLGFDAAR